MRPAIEAALAELERALCRDRCHVVVSASTGPARALLLGALAERVAGVLRVIPLPDPGPDGDLCAAILRELDLPCGDDPEASFLGVARGLASHGSALALVVGDARSLPAPTLRRLGRLAAQARPGLRLVLVSAAEAGSERDAIAEFMGPLGIGAVKVVLDEPARRERPAPTAAPQTRSVQAPAARAASPAGIRVSTGPRRAPRSSWLVALALAVALGLVAMHRLGAPPEQAELAPRSPSATPPAPRAARATPPPPRAAAAPPIGVALAVPAPPPSAAPPAPAAASEPPARAAAAAPPAKPEPEPLPAVARAERAAPEVAAQRVDAPDVVERDGIAPALALRTAAAPTPLEVAVAEDSAAPEAPEPQAMAVEEARPPAPTIRVSLNAQPWAHIEVDGRDVGVTPLGDLELTPGPHRFRARFPDGRVMERTVRVDAVRDHIHFP